MIEIKLEASNTVTLVMKHVVSARVSIVFWLVKSKATTYRLNSRYLKTTVVNPSLPVLVHTLRGLVRMSQLINTTDLTPHISVY